MSKVKEYPTQSELKRLYSYEDGNLIHNFNYPQVRAGDVAGSVNANGYIHVGISGAVYRAHRLIWIYHFGENPSLDIDHVDGNKINNRIENLRLLSRSHNLHNARSKTRKWKGGCVGVNWVEPRKYFQATICVNYKSHYLGSGSLFEACCLRKRAELEHYKDTNLL
jgi:hypothetical protein